MQAETGSQKTPMRNTRTVRGDYIAEVVVDDTASIPRFHWFVRKRTTFEVVVLGEESSHESALQEAEDQVARLIEGEALPDLHHSAGA